MPEQQEIFTTVACVCRDRYERLEVLQLFSRLFCFEQVKALENFYEKLYTGKIKKKRRSRDER